VQGTKQSGGAHLSSGCTARSGRTSCKPWPHLGYTLADMCHQRAEVELCSVSQEAETHRQQSTHCSLQWQHPGAKSICALFTIFRYFPLTQSCTKHMRYMPESLTGNVCYSARRVLCRWQQRETFDAAYAHPTACRCLAVAPSLILQVELRGDLYLWLPRHGFLQACYQDNTCLPEMQL
jgi:hypothetical protein